MLRVRRHNAEYTLSTKRRHLPYFSFFGGFGCELFDFFFALGSRVFIKVGRSFVLRTFWPTKRTERGSRAGVFCALIRFAESRERLWIFKNGADQQLSSLFGPERGLQQKRMDVAGPQLR